MNIAHTVFDTPIHELTVPVENYEYNGNKFYIKRDDLQPFSFGGNKVRIAQKVILDMHPIIHLKPVLVNCECIFMHSFGVSTG